MFGYVNICRAAMEEADFAEFRNYYCGLCREIGRSSRTARLGLSYDMTFLALLLDGVGGEESRIERHRCFLHPFRKREVAEENRAIFYAAQMSILLGYYKLWDDWQDERKFRAVLASLLYRRAVRKIRKVYPEEDRVICDCLRELSELEKSRNADADEMADCFARILQTLFLPAFIRGENTRRTLSWMGYNLGRWIYLLDAANDVEKDEKCGQYNPYAEEYRRAGKAALYRRLEETLTYSLANAAAAYDLLDISAHERVLRNILFEGVRQSQAGVLKTEEKNGSI